MSALLKTLNRVANDYRQKPADIVRLVTPAQKQHRWPWFLAFGALIFMAASVGLLLWMTADTEKKLAMAAAPVASAQPSAAKIIKRHAIRKSLKPEAVGIALPASSLAIPQALAVEARAESGNPAVAVIADDIRDTPAAIRLDDGKATLPATVAAPADASIDRMLANAQILLDSGDEAGAITVYDRVLDRDNANRAALEGKAFALVKIGDYEWAAEIDRKLLKKNPDDMAARRNLVMALGQWDAPQALAELRHLVMGRPDFPPAQAALARAYARKGDYKKALAHQTRAVRLAPGNVTLRLDLAILYDRAGRRPEALALYRQVLHAYADDEGAKAPASLRSIAMRADYLASSLSTP